MLKAVFIDDENITLRLLCRIIDWESEGFMISGTASDGLEGLELCERVRPDIVIVDIRMPNMDGLAFIRELKKKEISAKVIILTAHDEFEYAQKAIPLGVSDYLLKPLDEKKLYEVLREIKKEIDLESHQMNQLDQIRNEIDRVSVELDFRKFLEAIDNGFKSEYTGILEEKLEKLNRFFKNYTAIYMNFIHTGRQDEDPAAHRALVEELIEDLKTRFMVEIFSTDNMIDKYTIITIFESKDEADHSLPKLLKHLQKCQENALKTGTLFNVGVSDLFYSARNLKQSYDQAAVACSLAFYPDTPGVHSFDELCHYSLFPEKYLIDSEARINTCIHTVDYSTLIGFLDESFLYFQKEKVLPASVYDFCLKCLQVTKREIARFYTSFDITVLPAVQMGQLKDYGNYSLLLDFMKRTFGEILQMISQYLEKDKNRALTEKGRMFLEENFTRKDLNIQDVSDYLGVSKNHFSRIFRETTGEGLWDYVTRLRIERAKQLLKDSNKTNFEISHMIGYESEYHFSRKFKEVVGVNPNHFRRL